VRSVGSERYSYPRSSTYSPRLSLTQVFERLRFEGAIIAVRFMFALMRSLVVIQLAL
jgi:hypothetical protein